MVREKPYGPPGRKRVKPVFRDINMSTKIPYNIIIIDTMRHNKIQSQI